MTTKIEYDIEFYEYLDELRRSGVTNMYGATPYLMDEFGMEPDDMGAQREASAILGDWMKTFSARKAAGETGD